ncbi:hypothetical protein [Paenibacillus alkalitolerans]|uniref:hypothetical protein n=1 Tax=Paenibacillus alkalitolerans TaxID=2799335 RepID=UPI0018F6CACF|nr:hypothetical protein [Paenibacillus alkalitolerans]
MNIPKTVLQALYELREKYDFHRLTNPGALLYDLNARGKTEAAEYLFDSDGELLTDRLKAAVTALVSWNVPE